MSLWDVQNFEEQNELMSFWNKAVNVMKIGCNSNFGTVLVIFQPNGF